MDSSVSPTHGAQEGTAWNGHFGCMCDHPPFVFNQFGHLERCALRPGKVHSAAGWDEILKSVIARYADRDLMRFFRADAAFAIPGRYEMLEANGYFDAIRRRANRVLQGKIAHLLKRPVGRPPNHVRRIYGDFEYQAASWDKPRRVVAKVAWHPGELFPRIGFVVTNLPMEPDGIIRFYNQCGTAEQHIKEGKQAINWTRLSCKGMAQNQVRLQLHALADNLGVFLQGADLPEEMADGSFAFASWDQLANAIDQDRREGRPSRPRHHVPACRGRGQWQSVQPRPGSHPATARTADSNMTVSEIKPEEKRLRGSVQKRCRSDQTPDQPCRQGRKKVRMALRMPKPQNSKPEGLDRHSNQRHNEGVHVPLGECRIELVLPCVPV